MMTGDQPTSQTEANGNAPIVVVGAGAAGLMAALFAAREGAQVILLEGTRDGGRKILIAGGGRCNVLPSVAEPNRFVTDSSPNSLAKILRSWPLDQLRAFFETDLRIPLAREEETGKLFPVSNRARDVRDGLVDAVRKAGAKIWFETRVHSVQPNPTRPGWIVDLESGKSLDASALIMATGGLSVPATGSDGRGLILLNRLGHTVHTTYPALTPLTCDPHLHSHLSGVSLSVSISAPGSRPRFSTKGGFLITHRGYSGPTVLDASHLAIRSPADSPQSLRVQWTRRTRDEWDMAFLAGKGTVGSIVERELPNRLGRQLLKEVGIDPTQPTAQLKKNLRRTLLSTLTDYPLPWTGDEGYKKAEVTGGGVALSEIDPTTLESRKHEGLFLCGEILDAFGPIGGHNFLWAWSTGRAAGLGAASYVSHDDFPESR